jgi:hypothetical protein
VDKPSAGRADGLLLAGNVGGTKTVLEIFSEDPGPGRPLAVKTYPSGAYPGPDAIAHEFLFSVRADRHRPGPTRAIVEAGLDPGSGSARCTESVRDAPCAVTCHVWGEPPFEVSRRSASSAGRSSQR